MYTHEAYTQLTLGIPGNVKKIGYRPSLVFAWMFMVQYYKQISQLLSGDKHEHKG